MADAKHEDCIDLSVFVKDVQIAANQIKDDALIRGLKSLGPITITGRWGTWAECPLCGLIFNVDIDGPYMHVEADGVDLGPCCDACALQVTLEP